MSGELHLWPRGGERMCVESVSSLRVKSREHRCSLPVLSTPIQTRPPLWHQIRPVWSLGITRIPWNNEDPSRLTVSCLFTAVLRGGGLLCVPAPEESWISFGLQWSSPQFLPSNSISHFTPFELISYTCHQNIINKLVISMVHPEPAGLLSKLLSNPRRSCWQYYLIICKNNLWEPKPMESTAVGSQKDMWANNRFQFQDNVGKKKEKDVGLDFTYPL